ncbi:unnamed protein product [Trifolium pratense]|uniref:Uncharacterized protein n=1 Tax=Trifolium pratense TaxID=57577 RepID=A0ACB0K690_TRIPR|nr:unnamed protein product [Trifolium pratense]
MWDSKSLFSIHTTHGSNKCVYFNTKFPLILHHVPTKHPNDFLELEVVKRPDDYEDDFNINGDGCCFYSMSGTLHCCDRCPANYHSRCIGGMKTHLTEVANQLARALSMSCYEHFTLYHERSYCISQDENEGGYALNNQKNNDGTTYVIIHVNDKVFVSYDFIDKYYQFTVQYQTNNKVLEDVGSAVIDRNIIPIDVHVREVDLAAQNFLLQDPRLKRVEVWNAIVQLDGGFNVQIHYISQFRDSELVPCVWIETFHNQIRCCLLFTKAISSSAKSVCFCSCVSQEDDQ